MKAPAGSHQLELWDEKLETDRQGGTVGVDKPVEKLYLVVNRRGVRRLVHGES